MLKQKLMTAVLKTIIKFNMLCQLLTGRLFGVKRLNVILVGKEKTNTSLIMLMLNGLMEMTII